MKTSKEMVNSLLERRDEYVARRQQQRRTAMKIASATCAFALVALGAFGAAKSGWLTPTTPPVDDPAVTAPTTEPTEELNGTGGEGEGCVVHSVRYHRIPGALIPSYDIEKWEEAISGNIEDFNIVNYVKYFDISREEFVQAMGWDVEKLDETIDDREGPWLCPYTYNQFLDAIYGDDIELKNWVFARERETWIKEE